MRFTRTYGAAVLLERDAVLAELRSARLEVRRSGRGRFVVVGGEAGVGKTSLLRHFGNELGDDATVLWGGCDSLTTPRPLGPLYDIAVQVGGELAQVLAEDSSRDKAFDAALRALWTAPRGTLVVIEDAHWADEATADFLTFLRRRIDATSALVVMTYRDDEVPANHPLRFVLAEIGVARDMRLHLDPLSVDAVTVLAADHDVDATTAHRITGGNPFFLTELLAAGGETTPPTVRDAVLARTSRLSAEARAVLDTIAIVPDRVELWLVDRLIDDPDLVAAVDECVDAGVLRTDGDGVMFRHELARLAVRDAVTPVRRRQLHERAVAALADPPTGTVDEARVAHHAFEAGAADAVLRYAPRAAERAVRVGAHRQAAEHLQHAVRYAGRLPVAEQVDLWSRLAFERSVLGETAAAIAAYETALPLCQDIGDRKREGALLARMSGEFTTAGRQREAIRYIEQSVDVLEPLGPSPELASAYTGRLGQHMLAREFTAAVMWGDRALALSRQVGGREMLSHALIQSGVAQFMGGDEAGHERMLEGIAIARDDGMPRLVALGYSQIGSGGGEVRRYDVAVPALEEGLAYCKERELIAHASYIQAWLSRCRLELGRWDEAEELCVDVLRNPGCVGISRMVAVTVLGRLRARRGDPGVWEALDESRDIARENGHLQRVWPAAVARAEAAWLAGQLDAEVDLLVEAHALALTVDYPWACGELAYWLTRAARPPATPGPAAEPHRLALEGRYAEAAAAWDAIGCPFEAALARLDSDDEPLVRAAHAGFDALGSRPAARLAAARLREFGVSVPRGPRASTRANPAGLTAREIEVVALLADGLRNAEIAERLVLSPRTVDHHVTRVLAKLEVSSRQAAAAKAQRMGLLADPTAQDGGKRR